MINNHQWMVNNNVPNCENINRARSDDTLSLMHSTHEPISLSHTAQAQAHIIKCPENSFKSKHSVASFFSLFGSVIVSNTFFHLWAKQASLKRHAEGERARPKMSEKRYEIEVVSFNALAEHLKWSSLNTLCICVCRVPQTQGVSGTGQRKVRKIVSFWLELMSTKLRIFFLSFYAGRLWLREWMCVRCCCWWRGFGGQSARSFHNSPIFQHISSVCHSAATFDCVVLLSECLWLVY